MSTTDLVRRAEKIYTEQLKSALERTYPDLFVAIEPDSADYFVGTTVSEASAAAHAAHPDRRSCVLRIGHRVTVHIGVNH